MADWISFHAKSGHVVRFLAGLWGVWKWHCNMVLDGSLWTAWRKVAHKHDDILRFLQPDMMHEKNEWLNMAWRPPPTKFLKLNVDGKYRVGEGLMGGGGVMRDSSGR